MAEQKKTWTISWKELLFQLVLHVIVFVFYSFDSNQPGIETYRVVFFLNYSLVAAFINYYLLPRFFYTKKYLLFLAIFATLITLLILLEELVLEQVFFPNTRRAQTFPGLLFTLLDILPVIIILSGFKFAWDSIGKQSEVEKLQAAIKESELQFLKSQINPHFLFNNLNNLYSYAIGKSDKTPKIILELSSVLRYMLYECKERYVPLAKEVEQIKNFTQLYQLQIEERGKVSFNAKDIGSIHKIAPLILIVFIENAFKHSQAGLSENIEIEIDIELEEDTLYFKCRNNFQPASPDANTSKGIGLQNVVKRLELLYPNSHQLEIKSTDNSYEVQLRLKLEKMNTA